MGSAGGGANTGIAVGRTGAECGTGTNAGVRTGTGSRAVGGRDGTGQITGASEGSGDTADVRGDGQVAATGTADNTPGVGTPGMIEITPVIVSRSKSTEMMPSTSSTCMKRWLRTAGRWKGWPAVIKLVGSLPRKTASGVAMMSSRTTSCGSGDRGGLQYGD